MAPSCLLASFILYECWKEPQGQMLYTFLGFCINYYQQYDL